MMKAAASPLPPLLVVVCAPLCGRCHPPAQPNGSWRVQRDLPAFPACRHRLTADDFRTEMTRRFAVCNEITGLTAAA
jgi:hypothetical protein